ncbi:MAG: Tetratricopeptide repeat protein [candidate division Zixibacteria bacterium RBG-1]|nr:MAG: Tetratricopeptide repeat protein [candidate division Zixibacteria bacterium RBG-1]OGC83917.1 MAG: hypothetical protein A2V73_03645 [candidate division Zixibacteria bacterium RBG_19FT_COMBO_42_43]
MKKIFYLILLTLIFTFNISSAEKILYLNLQVKAFLASQPDKLEILEDRTIRLIDDLETSAFLANFTLTLKPRLSDDSTATITVNWYGLPPELENGFKEIPLEFEKTAPFTEVGEIKCKNDLSFKIFLKGNKVVEESLDCTENPLDTTLWKTDNSIHFYFTYMKNSLADYFWNSNKSYLENEYERYKEILGFTPAGKLNYFYCSCPINQVVWDSGSFYALNLAKNSIYGIYNQNHKDISHPGLNLFLYYYYWGYAPKFIAEGAAGYYTLNHFIAGKLKKKKKLYPLKSLIWARDYNRKNREIAYWQSASLVRYIIETYGAPKFREFYQEVHEFNFETVLQKHYNKSLAEIESDWLKFIEFYRPYKHDLVYFGKQSTGFREYQKALELYQDLFKIYPSSPEVLPSLGNAYYLVGNYPEAQKVYRRWSDRDTTKAERFFILGNLSWLVGDIKTAQFAYRKACQLDTVFAVNYINLGKVYWTLGQKDSALSYFDLAEKKQLEPSEACEFFLAQIKRYLEEKDSLKVSENFQRAKNAAGRLIQTKAEEPWGYLKLGEAYLIIGAQDTALLDSAEIYLKHSEFLEDRPYYYGQILLDLGKTYLAKQQPDSAKTVLQQVIKLPSGFYEKKEAKELLAKIK